MKKILVLVLFISVVIIACHRTPPENSKPDYTIIEQSKIIGDTTFYSIDLQYPMFTGSSKETHVGLERLNKQMESFLDTAAMSYWGTDIEGARKVIAETGAHGKYELMNRYEILSKDVTLISLKFETYSYALGAHGFTALNTYNFDVKKGTFLKITDFLNLSTPENQKALNALLVKFFDNPKQCFDKEPSAGIDFEKFAVSPENLVFYYEAYELGAYYCGAATIKIPVVALKEAGIWKWQETNEAAKTA